MVLRGVSILVVSMSLVLPGCSLITVGGPPSTDPGTRPVGCTESLVPPILDTVPAAILLTIATTAAIQTASKDEGEEASALAGGLVTIVFGLPGLVFAGSAYYGYTRTGRCRAMNRRPVGQQQPSNAPSAPAAN